MMEWMACILAALSAGFLITLFVMLAIYNFIPRGKKSLGQHYFKLALQAHRTRGWAMKLEACWRVALYCFAIALLALPSWAVGMPMGLAPLDWHSHLARAAEYIQGCATLLLSLMVTAVVVFASLKKSYYTVFNIGDVARKYKLFGRVLFCLITHAACFLMLGIVKAFPLSPGWSATVSIFVILLTLWIMVDALLVLTHSFRIIFSVNQCEFTLLNELYSHARESDFSLAHKKCEDPGVARSMSQYLIARLAKAGRAFLRGLGHGPEVTQVEFFDAAQAPPQQGIKHMLRYLWRMALFSLPFALSSLGLLLINWSFIASLPAVVLTAVFSGVCLAAPLAWFLVLKQWSPLGQMCRITVYGPWAYRFADGLGQAVCYASEDAMFPMRAKESAWLRGLMSLLALFRILLLSGTWRIMLEDLEDMLNRTAGETGRGALDLLCLAYYLCCCLAYERLARGEGRQVLVGLKALPFDWSNPVFRSFARAALLDLTRDYTLAGRMDDNVQQALLRPLELPGACLPE